MRDAGQVGGRWALIVVILVTLVGLAPAAAAAAPPIDQIEQHVQRGINDNLVPGAALGVVTADGEVHLRGFGTAGPAGARITPDTPFVIGSVTKSFTAFAVMQLAERGVVDLDDPVSTYLPWFRVTPDDQTELVTVRTLLQQTSGLPALAGGPPMLWREDRPLLDTARTLIGTTLHDVPGATWEYANGNYVLLAALIEAVSGQSYGQYLRTNILEPLGMTSTFTDLAAGRSAGMTEGHRVWFGRPVAHTIYPEGLVPSGLLISTAADMTRYLQMLLGGGELDGVRVLSDAGVDELFRPAAVAHLGPWAKQPTAGYGAGWFVGGTPFGPGTAVFHPGATPDFGALAALVPQDGTALVLLVNAGPRPAGAAGAVDRIGAGAVSLLMGSEPATGRSMGTYYRGFNVAAGALLAGALALAVLSGRRPRGRIRRRWLRWTGVAATSLLALAVLAAPPFLTLGWWQAALWSPDHAAVLAALAVLLLSAAALQVRWLVRTGRAERSGTPPAPTGVATQRPAPARAEVAGT
jgi:CubicO group peptidase (beta-lactamase class C family)